MRIAPTELAIFANDAGDTYRVSVRRISDKRSVAWWGGFTDAAALAQAIRDDGRPVAHIPPGLVQALAAHGVTIGPQIDRTDPAVNGFLEECGL